jgi:3-hydroxyisobutyrate dehydrogenase-like beta-hydroxyacid dehydrogenase
MKLVASLLVAIHNVAAAEGILFGKKLGLVRQNVSYET